MSKRIVAVYSGEGEHQMMRETEKRSPRNVLPYISDRRQWSRTASDVNQVQVWTTATDYHLAEIHDESLTGLAVLIDDVSKLSVDREVRLTFPDRQLWAIVRHIQPPVNGKYRVGLAWGCAEGRFLSG